MQQKAYIPNLYGRRQDKPLKARQARLMDTSLCRVAIAAPTAAPLDPKVLFPHAEEIWLEIGFGGGEHLAWQAAHRPEIGLIGAETFINGVAKLLVRIEDAGIENVRIHFGDARPLMELLQASCLTRLFVLHPDPWPKKRHLKRRMISPWFLAEAARLLKRGGVLRVASDVDDYICWTLMHTRNAADFVWSAAQPSDWKERRDDWPETRYETKARLEGRRPIYLEFLRR